MYSIYCVSSRTALVRLVTEHFAPYGWTVRFFITGANAVNHISSRPHLWIIDKELQDMSSTSLLQRVKAEAANCPVLIVAEYSSELDRVLALEFGVDDFLTAPFATKELVLRSRNLLRLFYDYNPSPDSRTALAVPPYGVNLRSREVFGLDGKIISLTVREFELLLCLIKHKGQLLHRSQILEHVWGSSYVGNDRAVDDLVRRLRYKMPELPLETIYSHGYKLQRS